MPPSSSLWKVTLATLLSVGAALAQAQPRYSVTDLNLFSPVSGMTLEGSINNAGQIAGTTFLDDGRNVPFLYTPGVGTVNIGLQPPGGAGASWIIDATASSLNNAGQVTGSWRSDTGWQAFVYSSATGMVDIGALPAQPPARFASGLDINDYGTVIGTSFDDTLSSYRTFIYDPINGMRDLGTPPLTTAGGGGINNSGLVAGTGPAGTGAHAMTYDGAVLRDLGTLGGANSYANGINNPGMVVGYSDSAIGGPIHAFVHTQAGGMIDLQSLSDLPSSYYSVAVSLNDSGRVVGYFGADIEEPRHAFLFDSEHGFKDLNELLDPTSGAGWFLQTATSINAVGQIIGYGLFNGTPAAYLLTPLPEPATWLLMLAGIAGLRLRSRRST